MTPQVYIHYRFEGSNSSKEKGEMHWAHDEGDEIGRYGTLTAD
jgi:hypothetical protein